MIACSSTQDPILESLVLIHARRDDGQSVDGVAIKINDVALGATDGRGQIRAKVSGPDGAIFHVQAACPQGYDSPAELPPVVLGKFASLTQKDGSLELTVNCERQRRMAAILVRARVQQSRVVTSRRGRKPKRMVSSEGTHPVAGLSVMINGRERARTDVNGLAHLSLEAGPGTHVEVGLQTSGEAFAKLSPRSPAQGLNVNSSDDFFTVDQMFTQEHVIVPRAIHVAAPAPILEKPHTIRVFDGGEDSPALIHFK